MTTNAETRIRQTIADHGPITFAEFMHAALYGEGGYYSSGTPVSANGDYFTSPVAHPLFGALIAVQLLEMWQLLGNPAQFSVVELAAGNGVLAADITQFAPQLDGEFARALDYRAFDLAPPLSQHYPVLPLDELPGGITGCVLSNELLDAMPVHRFEIMSGEVREIFVGLDGGRLVELLMPPSTPLIDQRLKPFLENLPDGYKGEVNSGLDSWAYQQAQVIERGWVLTFDYGFERPALYKPARTGGSLRCYSQHTLGQDPLRQPGRQDITAHVDFTAVGEAMHAAGFATAGTTTQARFLLNLGLDAATERLRHSRLARTVYRANEMGIRSLADPNGMGRFTAAAYGRDAAGLSLSGFRHSPAAPAEFRWNVPLLDPARHINLAGPQALSQAYFEVQSLDDLFSDRP
jgi:SAM-dependent MidA family methyltransferase